MSSLPTLKSGKKVDYLEEMKRIKPSWSGFQYVYLMKKIEENLESCSIFIDGGYAPKTFGGMYFSLAMYNNFSHEKIFASGKKRIEFNVKGDEVQTNITSEFISLVLALDLFVHPASRKYLFQKHNKNLKEIIIRHDCKFVIESVHYLNQSPPVIYGSKPHIRNLLFLIQYQLKEFHKIYDCKLVYQYLSREKIERILGH